jgi:NAD(P)-dependent dehydrogenase (short-subunit alcohol dehydrogenase family)
MNDFVGISDLDSVVIIGARGGIGNAFVESIIQTTSTTRIITTSRDEGWCEEPCNERIHRHKLDVTNEESIESLAKFIVSKSYNLKLVLNCTGILHRHDARPERTWREFDLDWMRAVFDVNALGTGLLIKHLIPLMPRSERAIFMTLSARVGSIADNKLGGWYSYRASKAAQNMIVKTASIEARYRRPELILASLHPGTVDTALSEPFTARVKPEKLFTPVYSCERLSEVMRSLTPADSGEFFAWDGSTIQW